MTLLSQLLSIRFSLHRTTSVTYKAPGFLHGTYMLQKRGAVTQGDLVKHALDMKYGVDARYMLDAAEISAIRIQIVLVE